MWLLIILISYCLKSLFLFINNDLAQPTATLISGVVITVGINYWQIQINQKNREQDLEISQANREQELRIRQENNEEEILQKYLEGMEKLILDYDLSQNKQNEPVKNVARFKTLTVLRRLRFIPELHRAIVLNFLYDANLIFFRDPRYEVFKFSLLSCNFERANLEGANLNKIDIRGANFSEANFSEANLSEANFSEANLWRANFSEANLSEANFSEANLFEAIFWGADLRRADFRELNLSGVELDGADLEGANLFAANLKGAYFQNAELFGANLYKTSFLNKELKLASNWEKAIYTEAEWDSDNNQWVPKDKAANEAKIQEIRNSN